MVSLFSYCTYRVNSAKGEFSELACHCEEGEARRGNPHALWHSDDEASPKENGLPRQSEDWLAMTCFLSQIKNNKAEKTDKHISYSVIRFLIKLRTML